MLKNRIKNTLIGTPLEPIARSIYKQFSQRGKLDFTTSSDYWEQRYLDGGNSGAGSYGRLALYKAEVLNDFVAQHEIDSVIEFGSGDGNQLNYAKYPAYTGVDVSKKAVLDCQARFAEDTSKTFVTLAAYEGQKADLALSLDVIYHLVEDATYENYMETLYDAANRFVIVYTSNKNEQHEAEHVRHRRFTDWVDQKRKDFRLTAHLPNRFPFDTKNPDNTSFADFFIFERL